MPSKRKKDKELNLQQQNSVESQQSGDRFGIWSEAIARAMGTPAFLVGLTLFCALWILWNTLAPEQWRFDSAAIGFTALTLILSLQASYAAPMILLAQNRQDDRDRVQIEQDRQRAERNLADTEFLAREVVALRLALKDLPDRDWLRQELKSLIAEIAEEQDSQLHENSVNKTTGGITQAELSKEKTTFANDIQKNKSDDFSSQNLTKDKPANLQTGMIKVVTNPVTGRLDIDPETAED